jgi:hypothetical protein
MRDKKEWLYEGGEEIPEPIPTNPEPEEENTDGHPEKPTG